MFIITNNNEYTKMIDYITQYNNIFNGYNPINYNFCSNILLRDKNDEFKRMLFDKGIEKMTHKSIFMSNESLLKSHIDDIVRLTDEWNIETSDPFIIECKSKLEYKLEYDRLFLPPKITILSNVKSCYKYNLNKLKCFNISNWNPTNTFQLVLSVLKEIEKEIDIIDEENISETDAIFEVVLAEMNYISNEIDNIKIDINTIIKNENKNQNGNGTGYGHSRAAKWDINEYIKNENDKKIFLVSQFKKINETCDTIINKTFIKVITDEIRGLTTLEIDKNIDYYIEISKMIEKFDEINKNVITDFASQLDDLEIEHNLKRILDDVVEEESVVEKSDNKDIYCEIMKKLVYGKCEMKIDYKKIVGKSIKRIGLEYNTLRKSLPINYDSSVFLRVSENIGYCRFMIVGNKDTPYENGLFLFECKFSDTFPSGPPKVHILTTGGGRVRFNPNLYADGTVCLSLLGTWSGEKGESWNPETSTVLQLIVSIQSLIFIEDPYFNEPAYTLDRGTSHGKSYSIQYNKPLYKETVQLAMIDMIENPPVGFEEVVKEHFKLKKDYILNQVKEWNEKFSQVNYDKLKELLDNF